MRESVWNRSLDADCFAVRVVGEDAHTQPTWPVMYINSYHHAYKVEIGEDAEEFDDTLAEGWLPPSDYILLIPVLYVDCCRFTVSCICALV